MRSGTPRRDRRVASMPGVPGGRIDDRSAHARAALAGAGERRRARRSRVSRWTERSDGDDEARRSRRIDVRSALAGTPVAGSGRGRRRPGQARRPTRPRRAEPGRDVDRDRATATIRATATTLTIGRWFGSRRLARIQIGSVCSVPAVKVVTMISSNDRANASRPPARSAVRRRQRHVPERLPGVGAEVHRRLLERARRAAQAGDDVVVDDDHAERRVADDDRDEAERRCRSC